MRRKKPSVSNVLAALPAVQKAIEGEIAARVAVGEEIACSESEAYRKTAPRLVATISFSLGDRKTKRKSAA
jgi:hypothetical protein